VAGAAKLNQATLRRTLQEFISQVSAAGPDTVALVYRSGYGLRFNGDNYFVPADAIHRDSMFRCRPFVFQTSYRRLRRCRSR
jgi:uncharacterized caspase-like protein